MPKPGRIRPAGDARPSERCIELAVAALDYACSPKQPSAPFRRIGDIVAFEQVENLLRP